MVHFCETKYLCWHSLIVHHLSWTEDMSNETCRVCDNCLSCVADKPVCKDFSTDVIRLLKIAKEIITSGKISEMVALDIAAVFCKLKRANELGLSELPLYNEPFERKLKNKDNTLFVIDDLCVKGFLILIFQLRKTSPLTGNFSFKPIIIGLGDCFSMKLINLKF